MRFDRGAGGVLILVLIGCMGTACAPLYQDARLVGKGAAEITPAISPTLGTGGGSTQYLTTTYGVHALVGVTDRMDFGFGYGRPSEGGVNVVGFGPKFGLAKDRAALLVPVSFGFGGGIDTSQTFQLHPTAVFTRPMSPRLDLSPSVGLLIPFCDGCGSETLVRLNLGFGIRPNSSRVVFRPEFGVLLNPGESGVIWTLGMGFSFRTKP